MSKPAGRTYPLIRARAFLDRIVDGSPEDDARIWFENAQLELRLAAFIALDVAAPTKDAEIERLRGALHLARAQCGAPGAAEGCRLVIATVGEVLGDG
jgi:hypothetical protein